LSGPVTIDKAHPIPEHEVESQFQMTTHSIAELKPAQSGVVTEVGGERAFRRRLMEFGLVPGTKVTLRKVAPLGDPLELEVRGCRLSIRKREAAAVLLDH
jgi:Fe2+ transport system protein FeoA